MSCCSAAIAVESAATARHDTSRTNQGQKRQNKMNVSVTAVVVVGGADNAAWWRWQYYSSAGCDCSVQ
jgi:hypothetical protein